MSSTEQKPQQPQANQAKPRRPNETGTVSVQGYFRIFDPKTQKIYVEGRA